MGKKSKINKTNEDFKEKKCKVTPKKNEVHEVNPVTEAIETTVNDCSAEIRNRKKPSKILQSEGENVTSQVSRPQKNTHKKDTHSTKNKKIKFNDSDSEEVQTEVKKSKAKPLNDDEANVKDEDIDKFCDELDEEDNKQYDDWIKLLEEKLKSNKKKA